MEKMPLIILLLYSIPESIIVLFLGSQLYGYKIKDNIYRIIFAGTVLALCTYVFRYLPMNISAFIEMPAFIILTTIILKIPFWQSVFFILTGVVALALGESISYPTVSYVTGLSYNQLYKVSLYRIGTGWVHLILISLITFLMYRFNIKLTNPASLFKNRSNKLYLTLLVLVQAAVTGIFNVTVWIHTFNIWPIFENKIYILITSILLFVISIISAILIRKIYASAEKEAILQTQEAYLDNIDNLFLTLRGQRHDFINHVQILNSLLKTGQIEEAIKYMDNLLDDIQLANSMIKCKNPFLNALLNTKTAIAERYNIKFKAKVSTDLTGIKLKPFETVKILGNLIDNAFDAVRDLPEEKREVEFFSNKTEKDFKFTVSNKGPKITDDNRIFESNYTTKKNHSGLGLPLVKRLVTENGGEIELSNEEDNISFIVTIPF